VPPRYYADSGKIGVWAGDEVDSLIFKRSAAASYGDGEPGFE
jgi:hypothetical protein